MKFICNLQALLRVKSQISPYYFIQIELLSGKPGSSVDIVSGYGLDDQVIEVRSPEEAKGFFL
jgi:hypothetical protein